MFGPVSLKCDTAESDFGSTDNHHFPPTLHSLCESNEKSHTETLCSRYLVPWEFFEPEDEHGYQYHFGCGRVERRYLRCTLETDIGEPSRRLSNIENTLTNIIEEISEKLEFLKGSYKSYVQFFNSINRSDITLQDLNFDLSFHRSLINRMKKTAWRVDKLSFIVRRLEQKADKIMRKIIDHTECYENPQIYIRDSDTIIEVIHILGKTSKSTTRKSRRIWKMTRTLSKKIDNAIENSNKFVVLD